MTQRCAHEVGQIVHANGAPIRIDRIHPIGERDWLIVGCQGRDTRVWVMWSTLDPEPPYGPLRLICSGGERIGE